jgi:hypothetical protein
MAYPAFFAKLHFSRTTLSLLAASALVFVAGCNSDTCFVGVINAPSSSVLINTGNLPGVCSGLQTPAAISLTVQLAPVCTGCTATRQVSIVHLALSGVELHPGGVADENSPEWQEIAPDLEQHPVELELSQDPASSNLALPATISGRIPAGLYYQLRLRLADPSSPRAMQLCAANHGNSAGASCLATADGARHPLQTLDGSSYLRVPVTSPIDVRSGQANRLHLELSPEWLLQNGSTGSLEVAPLLYGGILPETVSSAGSL